MKRLVSAILVSLCLAATAPAQVTFQFDYTYDDNNFFTGANVGNQTYLTNAASYVASFINGTALAAITPGGGNSWTPQIFDPRNTAVDITLGNLSVSANTIVVYAGGYDLPGSTLGVGGPTAWGAVGDQPWFDSILYRGNGSNIMTGIGAITFDTATSWHFDNDTSTTETFAGQSDFFTVAVHELFHLLGFGTNVTWNGLISGASPTSTFIGAASVAENGGAILLDPGEGHWVNGTNSVIFGTATAQETVMDPSITVGTRKYVTDLDAAGLQDLGYATAIPEPGTYAVLLGVATLLLAARRRAA